MYSKIARPDRLLSEISKKVQGECMQYHHVDYAKLEKFCQEVFKGYHFSEEESRQITDVLLAADLSGIESHGIQRLIRYHQ